MAGRFTAGTSLAHRLVLVSTIWLVLAGLIGGVSLRYSFETAVTDRFDVKLDAMARLLASKVANGDGILVIDGEPRFETPGSGWYWMVLDGPNIASTSESVPNEARIPWPEQPGSNVVTHMEGIGPGDQQLRAARANVPGIDRQTVIVAIDATDLTTELASFSRLFLLALAGLGVILVATIAGQVTVGLWPLRKLRKEILEITAGGRAQLSRGWPTEISPVADALNEVLDHDRRVVERARKAAGNLAHGIKTELMLLQSSEGEQDRGDRIAAIRALIDHHLARSSASGAGRPGASVDTVEVLTGLHAAFSRMTSQQDLDFDLDVSSAPAFAGDASDLEEIVGNLVENAIRFTITGIGLTAETAQDGRLLIIVEDDGPGLPEADRQAALKRGVRLDERGGGSGLGLAIAAELIELYGGTFALEGDEGQGLRAMVVLPSTAARN